MSDEIIGSHMKSQRNRGQAQDGTGSSTREKSLPPMPNVSVPNANTANANAKDDDARLAAISGKPVKAHGGMRSRSHEGGTIPATTMARRK